MLLLKNIQVIKKQGIIILASKLPIPVMADITLDIGLDVMVDNSPTEEVAILGVDVDVIILDDAVEIVHVVTSTIVFESFLPAGVSNVWTIEELSSNVD